MKLYLVVIIFAFSFVLNSFSYWEELNIPFENKANAIVNAIALNGSTIYVGCYNHGVFRSTDNGNTWFEFNKGVFEEKTDIYKIDKLIVSNNVLYATTVGGFGVFYFDVVTQSWKHPINNGLLTLNAINSIATNGKTLFIGVGTNTITNSVFKGSFGSWDAIGLDESGLQLSVSAIAAEGSTIYAGTGGTGFYISTNEGEDWKLKGLFGLYFSSIIIKDFLIFAATYDEGIYLSRDNGDTWEQTGLYGKHIRYLVANNQYIFAATNDGVYLSRDNGETWQARNKGLSQYKIGSIAINDDYVFIGVYGAEFGEDGKVYRTTLENITSVSENNLDPKILLYPNPSADILHIQSEKAIRKIEISDVLGRLILSNEAPNIESINIDGLSSGLYFVKMFTYDGEMSVERFVVGY